MLRLAPISPNKPIWGHPFYELRELLHTEHSTSMSRTQTHQFGAGHAHRVITHRLRWDADHHVF